MSRPLVIGVGFAVLAVGLLYALNRRPTRSPEVVATVSTLERRASAGAFPALPSPQRPPELPPNVPTREEVGIAPAVPPPPRPEAGIERATTAVHAELDDTRRRLGAAAGSCLEESGKAQVKVDVVFRAGEAIVRKADIVESSFDPAVESCIQAAVAKRTWHIETGDKVFSLTFPVVRR